MHSRSAQRMLLGESCGSGREFATIDVCYICPHWGWDNRTTDTTRPAPWSAWLALQAHQEVSCQLYLGSEYHLLLFERNSISACLCCRVQRELQPSCKMAMVFVMALKERACRDRHSPWSRAAGTLWGQWHRLALCYRVDLAEGFECSHSNA